ncbi:enoyl-CoA hydratase-related protein, partial [Acidisphaera rubrifaciens]|uniref:enoyl-CoA hydratase-related protein n=1 Tax=Acidisphaera rubrifaciens TaxID=50715 RepID=UPI0006627E00
MAGRVWGEVAEGVATVTFDQPEKHNAMSVGMWDELAALLDEYGARDEVRVVVLTGAGEAAFVSGADISQFDTTRGDAAAQREYHRLTAAGRAR